MAGRKLLYLLLVLGGAQHARCSLEQWCGAAASPYALAYEHDGVQRTVSQTIDKRAYLLGSCWWLVNPAGRGWYPEAAAMCGSRHPTQPAGVDGRLALVHTRPVYDTLLPAFAAKLSAGARPWIGLRRTVGNGTLPAGWYHEGGGSEAARRWDMPVGRYPAPWANEDQPVAGHVYGSFGGDGKGVYTRAAGETRRYFCQYRHRNERPAVFRKVADGRNAWPAAWAQLANHTVRPSLPHSVTDCGRRCTADSRCAGFAVAGALCTTAIDVLGDGALQQRTGFDVYERVVRLA